MACSGDGKERSTNLFDSWSVNFEIQGKKGL